MYFGENRLFDLADDFYKNAGEYLFIDEIHKYTDWSRELKNIYDSFPTLKVVFTGSSVLDILKGSADLSLWAIVYKLQGLSFREYLKLFHNYDSEVYTLEQIINNEVKLEHIEHPLPLFNDYLKRGYYPFGVENEINLRLGQIIVQTLESDIPQYANLNVGTSRKLKRLLFLSKYVEKPGERLGEHTTKQLAKLWRSIKALPENTFVTLRPSQENPFPEDFELAIREMEMVANQNPGLKQDIIDVAIVAQKEHSTEVQRIMAEIDKNKSQGITAEKNNAVFQGNIISGGNVGNTGGVQGNTIQGDVIF